MTEATLIEDTNGLSKTVPASTPRQPGSAIGIVTYIADDFDAPLGDFEEDGQDEGLKISR